MSDTFLIDFRLNEVGLELSSLKDYHDLLVSEFKRLEDRAVEQAEPCATPRRKPPPRPNRLLHWSPTGLRKCLESLLRKPETGN